MYDNEKFKASGGTLALSIIGTIGTGLLAVGAGGNGGLFNGGLFGNNNCMWSDREVSLQRQIDYVGTQQAVTAAVTPYQIREATCDFVKAEKYVPNRHIVYSQTGRGCNDGYNCDNGYGCI